MPPTPPPTRLIALLLLLLSTPTLAGPYTPCFFPSSTTPVQAPGFYPCTPYGIDVSACCPQGWTCFSSSLCIATIPNPSQPSLTYDIALRAACTNPKWDNATCGSFCLDDDNQSGELVACTPFSGDQATATFCCKGDFDAGRCACATPSAPGNNTFTLDAGVAQTIVQVDDVSEGLVTYVYVDDTRYRPNLTIGVTVASILGVLGAVGLLLLWLWWRRRRAAAEGVKEAGATAAGGAVPRGHGAAPPGATEHREGWGEEHGTPMEERVREDHGDGPVYGHR
ncbi:hypothetical protein QBC39DRAFT_419258 [Podospora conica]|nr:hypothetical protein QBC39DRAFT_419258 [Schizothecium conicum]